MDTFQTLERIRVSLVKYQLNLAQHHEKCYCYMLLNPASLVLPKRPHDAKRNRPTATPSYGQWQAIPYV